jgi:hypothetical protein
MLPSVIFLLGSGQEKTAAAAVVMGEELGEGGAGVTKTWQFSFEGESRRE